MVVLRLQPLRIRRQHIEQGTKGPRGLARRNAYRNAKLVVKGTLPAPRRAEPRGRSLWRVTLRAVLTYAPANGRNPKAVAMKYRARVVLDVESIPAEIIHAVGLGALDPFDAADRNDVRTMRQERHRLFGRGPIRWLPRARCGRP
jgi:hypothetical protein